MKDNLPHTVFRLPEKKDATAIHRLIEDSPPLDINSLYCYLLLCTHFSRTSIVAECSEEICGFISAYISPERSDILFVWQVVVKKDYRGKGIASGMLSSLLSRTYPVSLRYLETTVNPSNESSNALFSSLTKSLNTSMVKSVLFAKNDFGNATAHEDEILYRIGPFNILK